MALSFQLVGRLNFGVNNMTLKLGGTNGEDYMFGKFISDLPENICPISIIDAFKATLLLTYLSTGIKSNEPGLVVELGKSKRNGRRSSTTLAAHSRKEDLVSEFPPLVSALKASAEQDVACFHFPGHNRGRAAPSSLSKLIGVGPFLHDLPELPELDNLFAPQGPILEAQQKAAQLFGSSETWFLVGGTTCGIQAAIMSTCSPGETLILPRNSHLSAISAMVLSGALPKYIIPDYDCDWDIAGGITPFQVEKTINELKAEGRRASAVLVISPTYHGICSKLSEISHLCHLNGIPLIVDEAHGAHFGFHDQFPSPAIRQGADVTVQSTHKVLCSLTQSSMLHLSGNLVDRDRISRCLQTLQSSSPSYLLLASLDAARAQLSENPQTIFDEAVEKAVETKRSLSRIAGIAVLDFPSFAKFPSFDPLRLTVGVWKLGLSGYQADEILFRGYGIVPELCGTRSLTMAINLGTSEDHVRRLVSGLEHLSSDHRWIECNEKNADGIAHAPFDDITISLSPREAFFARKRKVSVKECLGKICGELICPYPPGIPVMIPGEVITEKALSYLMQVKNMGADISGAADPSLNHIMVCDSL
ncbi:arginine decarboxylase-like [Impatiens glandulifera]|uniref:arginine decarboxylase-like n=1 Tax=Impatiens glandulifera TaxID=253017 RepID=UPI001FB06679|nr:arginine decarboxylase-like [Impatiens glandulifera]